MSQVEYCRDFDEMSVNTKTIDSYGNSIDLNLLGNTVKRYPSTCCDTVVIEINSCSVLQPLASHAHVPQYKPLNFGPL